jgi:hypothetical protein
LGGCPRSRQVVIEQIDDTLDGHISRRKGANHFRIVSVASLPGEHGRHVLPPELLDRRQDPQLVVNKDVMLGWEAPLDVIKGLVLDQHSTIHRVGETGALYFVRLEDDVAVGQDDGRADALRPCLQLTRVPLGSKCCARPFRIALQNLKLLSCIITRLFLYHDLRPRLLPQPCGFHR